MFGTTQYYDHHILIFPPPTPWRSNFGRCKLVSLYDADCLSQFYSRSFDKMHACQMSHFVNTLGLYRQCIIAALILI